MSSKGEMVPSAGLPSQLERESFPGLDLRPEDVRTVTAILERYAPGVEVRVFGSRVGAQAKRYSDLDLMLCGSEPLPTRTLSLLAQAFADSDLPIKVDIIDGATTAPAWRERVLAHSVVIRPAAA